MIMNGTVEDGGRKITVTGNLITLLLNTYGPYAFGLVLFLSVWHTTIKPQLDRQALDWGAQREILRSQREVTKSLVELAQSLESTISRIENNAK